MNVLTVNVGSSTLKLSVIGPDGAALASEDIERWESGAGGPIEEFLSSVEPVGAVAHRVVHGGDRFTGPALIDDAVIDAISALADLAPLHQPRALAGIEATRRVLGGVAEVACFDTAFHAGMPAAARTYALPLEWSDRWPLRRYGFHGLSHAYAFGRACAITGSDPQRSRMVTCHLGSGASLCAVDGGRSVDTTMGFTPVEGLVMGTRSGSVDPGLVLWLIQAGGLDPADVSDALEHRSGLAGLSGGHSDMRDVLSGRAGGDERCRLAFDVYVHRLAGCIGAMVASLGRVDGLVFTGGVGEHSPEVRDAVASRLGHLGVAIDTPANQAPPPDSDISRPTAPVRTVVVAAREDLEMDRQARALTGV